MINPPAILPSSGVTSVSFKAWLRTLTAYLEQDINTPLFMPDGAYSTWLPHFDPKLMRHVDKIFVPPTYMPTLLTVIHLKCNHPSKYQMEQIFQRYFFAPPGLESKLATLCEQCYTCQSVAKLKPVSNPAPPSSPAHPGTHMQADIIRRNRQLILVNTDLFSNYATTCFIHSEQKQDLMNGLIQITTPIRWSETIVRTALLLCYPWPNHLHLNFTKLASPLSCQTIISTSIGTQRWIKSSRNFSSK
jgi:hypothetical protein